MGTDGIQQTINNPIAWPLPRTSKLLLEFWCISTYYNFGMLSTAWLSGVENRVWLSQVGNTYHYSLFTTPS